MIFKKKNLFFIGLVIFIVLVFCFYNNVFAAEDVPLITLDGIDTSNGYLVSASGRKVSYFHAEDGYIYTITFNYTTNHALYVSYEEPSEGVPVTFLTYLDNGESYSFVGGGDFYLSSYSGDNNDRFTVTRDNINGFDNTTSALVNSVSLDNLWAVVPPTLIALGVLFAIGYIVVKKVLKRDSNAY